MILHGFDLFHGDSVLKAFKGAQTAPQALIAHRDALAAQFDGLHGTDVDALAALDTIIGAVSPPANGSEPILHNRNRHYLFHLMPANATAGAT
jgi:hypothetical protein